MTDCNPARVRAGNQISAAGLTPVRKTRTTAHVKNLWRSGMILSFAALVGGAANYLFQGLIGRQLSKEEYGLVNPAMSFVGLLGLPVSIATMAIVHYIAHFRATDRDAHLRGLLAGCRKFLLRLTIAGSLVAVVLAKPLADFFNFPRVTLLLAVIATVLVGLWAGFATTLCQGLGWFTRLAVISLVCAALRLGFGAATTATWSIAELAITATTVSFLGNLLLLRWRGELRFGVAAESPWNAELGRYFLIAAVSVGGGYFLTQGDWLVAQRHLTKQEAGDYGAAGIVARALLFGAGPFLTVLFTARSSGSNGGSFGEQLKLVALYAAALFGGAAVIYLFRDLAVRLIFGQPSPEAALMVTRLTLAMVFVGLIQMLGMWALASRWTRVAVLYGVVGLGYWLTLLLAGTNLERLLQIMPAAAALGFVILFGAWFIAFRAEVRERKEKAG
jgi:O-antigen/teichoic acid export membrane protein